MILNCPSCENEYDHEVKHLVCDRHYGNKGEFTLISCKNCELISLSPMPNMKELSKFYPEESYYAFSYTKKKYRLKKLVKSIFLRTMLPNEIKFKKPGKLLDYGCGNGWKLHEFQKKGWDVTGCEPNKDAVIQGAKAFQVNIIQGTFYNNDIPSSEFDYVRSYHSLEHDPKAYETIKHFYRVLKPGGKLLLGVPNYDSIQRKIFGDYWWYLGAPVHTYNFSSGNLIEFLDKVGFKIIKINYVSNYQGILGSACFYFNRKKTITKSNEIKILRNPLAILIFQLIAILTNILRYGDSIEISLEK